MSEVERFNTTATAPNAVPEKLSQSVSLPALEARIKHLEREAAFVEKLCIVLAAWQLSHILGAFGNSHPLLHKEVVDEILVRGDRHEARLREVHGGPVQGEHAALNY